ASLPTSLGGIGITDPLTEGIYGFIASFTQAALFLSSLALEPEGALTMAKNHMLAPRESGTPLHSWLTECEAALPLDAREILEKERLERSDVRLQHVLGLKVHGSRYAVQVQATRHMQPNPLSGHTQRMFSLTGYGTGDWLTAIPIEATRRIGPVHFANAMRFRLGLPFSTPKNCDCVDQTAITDPCLPNHLLRCGTGKHRINTHNELRDACIIMAQHAGFIVHSESAVYCPIEEQTADFTMTDRSSGAVYLLADTSDRRHFNADSKSFYAAKFLHLFWQHWSVALQRAQSVGLLLKLGEAAAAENPPIGDSCDIRVPTCETEQARVWAQASLPPSLGGIGLTDPLVEGVYGYTASFTQAALFFSTLTLEPFAALIRARNHMLLPRDITTPLHTWLTGCEAALPRDTREILEQERLKRSDIRLQHVLGLKKGRGWAAREQADKKIQHYANRPETVSFFPLAVETYGCPCAEVPVFLKLLADTAARRHFNADSKSFHAAKFLHQFRQRWSVALQRAQSVGLLLKLGEAAAAENPPVGGIGQELILGDCFAVVEPLLEL
ncbi:unnamed protein product, partial [Closterium sp. NIES-53]